MRFTRSCVFSRYSEQKSNNNNTRTRLLLLTYCSYTYHKNVSSGYDSLAMRLVTNIERVFSLFLSVYIHTVSIYERD